MMRCRRVISTGEGMGDRLAEANSNAPPVAHLELDGRERLGGFIADLDPPWQVHAWTGHWGGAGLGAGVHAGVTGAWR